MNIVLGDEEHKLLVASATRMYPEGDDIITLADVRLAILAETLAEEKFHREIDFPSHNTGFVNSISRPKNFAEIEREWGRYAQLMKEKLRERDNYRREGAVKPMVSGRFIIPDE